jgi:hypothetical protein
MTLPVVINDIDGPSVVDPSTGELSTVHDASDRALAHAAEQVARLDRELWAAKRALAHELRQRYGVGRSHAGGYAFTIAESVSWPVGTTSEALEQLVADDRITAGDADRCMPLRPKPDARQLKALAGRLATSDPEAAKVLAEACTTSPPSIREVEPEAVDAREAA